MKTKIYISILVLALNFIYNSTNAQGWLWAKSAGGNASNSGSCVATDFEGNVYVVGSFIVNTIKFGNYTLKSEGGEDIFLVKYDATGKVLWAISAGGFSTDIGKSVTTDAQGNVYITGYFSGPSVTFGSTTLKNEGGYNIFVAKFNSSGEALWAKAAGRDFNNVANSICTDPWGNVYVTGYFQHTTITFGKIKLAHIAADDFYLVKYDSLGNALWAKGANGKCSDMGSYVTADAFGNVYVLGKFYEFPIIFGSDTLLNTNYYNDFIVKYDTAGNMIWAKQTNKSGHNVNSGLALDNLGNMYVVGAFTDSILVLGKDTLKHQGYGDILIVKYDTAGNVIWAKGVGGTGNDKGNSISVDGMGNFYITGSFGSSSISFGGSTIERAGYSSVFLAKYDTAGIAIWAKGANGTLSDVGNSVLADTAGNVYVTGYFAGSQINFGQTTLTSLSNSNFFLAKNSPCSNSSASIKTSACDSLIWRGKTYSKSGIYIETIPNAGGCDSIITLDITIHPSPTVTMMPEFDTVCVSAKPYLLTGGSPSGGVYIGAGITKGNTFDPALAGLGAHVITYYYEDKYSCDNSTKAEIFVESCTGIQDVADIQAFNIYPNPYSQETILQFRHEVHNATITIENSLGQSVKEIKNINGHSVVLLREDLPNGLYFIYLKERSRKIGLEKVLIVD